MKTIIVLMFLITASLFGCDQLDVKPRFYFRSPVEIEVAVERLIEEIPNRAMRFKNKDLLVSQLKGALVEWVARHPKAVDARELLEVIVDGKLPKASVFDWSFRDVEVTANGRTVVVEVMDISLIMGIDRDKFPLLRDGKWSRVHLMSLYMNETR